MRRAIRRILLPLIVMILAIACLSCANNTSSRTEKDKGSDGSGTIVAKVNGQPVYENQLTPYVDKGIKSYAKFSARQDTSELGTRLRERALDQLIGQELVYQESQKLTESDIAQKVEEQIDSKINMMKSGHPSDDDFEEDLRKKNLSVDNLRESLRKQIYMEAYLKEQGISDPEIPEEEIRAFYDKDPSSFHREESVDVSHILIQIEKEAPSDKVNAAKSEAEKIRKEILAGADFADMAKEYSDCNSASGGGRLGYIHRGYMPKEFDAGAFQLEKERVSEPIRTEFGYHLIQIHEKTSAGDAPYAEMKDFIAKFLKERVSKKKLNEHIAELKQKANIELFLDES